MSEESNMSDIEQRRIYYKAKHKSNLYFYGLVASLFFASSLGFYSYLNFVRFKGEEPSKFLQSVIMVTFFGLIMSVFMRVLKRDNITDTSLVTISNSLSPLYIELNLIKGQLRKLKKDIVGLNENQKNVLVNDIISDARNEASAELWSKIEQKAEESLKTYKQFNKLETQYEISRNRLALEIESLGTRGNLNLILGILITAVGLAVLGHFAFAMDYHGVQLIDFIFLFLPRLTLILFIELFAYFFLRLYKASLLEIKYFQNEITNIEAKYLALLTGVIYEDKNMIAEAVLKIAATEKNHILEKGQTTVDIERARIDNNGDIERVIAALVKKINLDHR